MLQTRTGTAGHLATTCMSWTRPLRHSFKPERARRPFSLLYNGSSVRDRSNFKLQTRTGSAGHLAQLVIDMLPTCAFVLQTRTGTAGHLACGHNCFIATGLASNPNGAAGHLADLIVPRCPLTICLLQTRTGSAGHLASSTSPIFFIMTLRCFNPERRSRPFSHSDSKISRP